jgi:hypothetical protein
VLTLLPLLPQPAAPIARPAAHSAAIRPRIRKLKGVGI